MYIRRTHTNNSATGERYSTFRLVANQRINGKPRQVTVLNLGRYFAIDQNDWPSLCARIEALLSHQESFFPINISDGAEKEAQRIVAQLLARRSEARVEQPATFIDPANPSVTPSDAALIPDFQCIDVDSLELTRPRSVGVEQLGLWAMQQLNLIPLLTGIGLNGSQLSAVIGLIIARMAKPGSELATHRWLGECSGLGELIDVDYEAMQLMALYRASDVLWKHHATIEQQLFARVQDLFSLSATVTLYDLTNTYFEGVSAGNSKAKRGRSKEKRRDCPLVTLGLVLDSSGFVRSSQTFAGNVSEAGTLETMLNCLSAPTNALVVMDAGIATETNIDWLRSNGYRYLVVSRERNRQFDVTQGNHLETASGDSVHCQKVLAEDGEEVRLYCYSEARSQKEQAMTQQFSSGFETALDKLADGLQRPRTEKRIDKLWERIGRLKEKHHGIGQHYVIELQADESGEKAIALTWMRQPVAGSIATHPGVYCLRSSETDWDAEKLWRTYIMLTDLEAVFRSLKSDLGLRPIYHHKEERVDGHLFITVLAYQLVQVIRRQLQAAGINDSWKTLRDTMAGQCRVTASFRKQDQGAIHIRKATRAEPSQLVIYRALNLNSEPGGISKTHT